jgi:inhibitor of the pro-sigma K processing machinery
VATYLFIAFAVIVLFLLFLITGISFHPVRWFGKLTVRLLLGALFLFILNVVGESFSLHIPINLATTAISGLLGLPGIAALVLIKYTIGV